jgi:uncharacterized protein involved in type VI secretion and phage assembly
VSALHPGGSLGLDAMGATRRVPYGAPAGTTHLATVVDVNDPDGRARVRVRLVAFDGETDHDAPLWARVAVPFAGSDAGAFMLPGIGDEVLVTFVDGDARQPVVVGSLWNGADAPPETLPGNRVDRWTIVGRAGTRIAIVEESAGSARITLATPGESEIVTITQDAGGKIELKAAGNTVTLDTGGVAITAAAKVTINASQVEVTAGMVRVDAAMSRFSGVVQCDTLITNAVVSASYTPGAGNIW